MDQPSVDRRSRDGAKLDYGTSNRLEEPRWKRMMRSLHMGISIGYRVTPGLVDIWMILSLPEYLCGILGIGWHYYLFRFRRELLWWLLGEFRAWHAQTCVDIFNFKNACATFVKKLSIGKTDRRNDELKHFKWTCYCGRTFEETAREVVFGGVAEWIDAWGFPYEPMAQLLSFTDRTASVRYPTLLSAFPYRSAVRFGAVWALLLVRTIYGVLALIRLFFDFESESGGPEAKPYHISDHLNEIGLASGFLFLAMPWGPPKPVQKIEHIDTSLMAVTGEPIAAPHAETIGLEQGGRAPRDRNSPPSPKIEREDAPPHSEYVLLLIKQGRHRMKFFSANIQGRWTDRDTFSRIKDHYHHYKSSWWYLNTLSHVEFKKFYIYHSNHVDIADREKEEVPVCEQICASGCGMGCLGYWYSPPRAKMIPPIPRKAMLHFLESPDCLGTKTRNRAALPKRRDTLKLGDLHLREGWGLRFKEKVWSLPIVTVQLLSIISAIVVTVCWTVFHEKNIGALVPGVFILLIGQSIAALLQRWAESNLDEELKA